MTKPSLLRYSILYHNHPFPHWDLLMENGSALSTWRLHSQPVACSWISAEVLPDHRLIYLDYEGPVSRNRGSVSQLETGRFSQDLQRSTAVLRVFRIYDSALGTTAFCRKSDDHSLHWRFE